MANPLEQARRATGLAVQLYGEQARGAYDAYVRRDPFTRLRHRPGRDDPYPVYERIRAGGPFVVTRMGNLASVDHAVCREVLRSRRFGVQPEGEAAPDDGYDLSFLDRNPPDHTRLRRLVIRRSAPSGWPATGARSRRRSTTCSRPRATEFDLVTGFAPPLPVAVISELLGLPEPEGRRWRAYAPCRWSGIRLPLPAARAGLWRRPATWTDFGSIVEQHRTDPRDDLISALLAAEGRASMIRPTELVPLCRMLLIAGFETTVGLFGNAVDALLDHPDQWALLA